VSTSKTRPSGQAEGAGTGLLFVIRDRGKKRFLALSRESLSTPAMAFAKGLTVVFPGVYKPAETHNAVIGFTNTKRQGALLFFGLMKRSSWLRSAARSLL
jgi:hypothetical protein